MSEFAISVPVAESNALGMPAISPNLYGASDSDAPWSQLVNKIRNLHADSKGVDPCQVAILKHRRAFEAECSGQFNAASGYWSDFQTAWNTFARTDSKVRPMEGGLGIQEPSEPEIRRDLLVRLVVSAHAAFYNGDQSPIGVNSRRLFHLDQILGYVEPPSGEFESLAWLTPAMRGKILALKERHMWKPMRAAIDKAIQFDPRNRSLQSEAANFYWEEAAAGMRENPSSFQSALEAISIREAAGRVAKLIAAHPENPDLYETIGSMHFIAAVRNANGDKLHLALEDILKASAYWPYQENLTETSQQLHDMMAKLIEVANEFQASLKFNQKPNEQGEALLAQAKVGFSLARNFVESGEMDRIANSREEARSRGLFETVGLAPPDNDLHEAAQILSSELGEVLEQAQPGVNIENLWSERVKANPKAEQFDSDKVVRYLQNRLLPDRAQGGEHSGSDVPMIVTTRAAKQSGESFAEYWRSKRSNFTKVLGGLAAASLLLGGYLTWKDSQLMAARNGAFTALLRERANGNQLGVLENAKRFLSNPPMSGMDPRKNDVKFAYAEALVEAVHSDRIDESKLKVYADFYRPYSTTSN